MCYGQFSVTDPRCINYCLTSCYWCSTNLEKDKVLPTGELLWASKEAQKLHTPTCPMYKLWEDNTL